MAGPESLIRGAIDMHVHSAPDLVERRQDDLELVRSAREAGLRAVVLKCHQALTADRAALVQRMVEGIHVFGGLVLNSACGGLNPRAVEIALGFGARIIWMPTVSAANHLDHARSANWGPHVQSLTRGESDGISILDRHGGVRPEVLRICELVAQAGVVLATGHLSREEVRALVRAAQARKVEKLVITHPEVPMIGLTMDDQKALAGDGVMFERCLYSTCLGVPLKSITEAIRAVGTGSTVLATDFGQSANPPAVEGLASYLSALLEDGFTPEEIRRMTVYNPAGLLDLHEEDP